MVDKTYIGRGPIYMGRYNDPTVAVARVGNCSSLNLSFEEDVKSIIDYQTTGGGNQNELRTITGITLTMTLHEMLAENLKKALFATSSLVAAGIATDEVHTAVEGGLIALDKPNPSAVVVKDTSGTPTYVLNTDYTVTKSGVFILPGAGITSADVLKITYDYVSHDAIQALADSQKDYSMVFEGLNEAQSGAPFVVKLWRVKIGAVDSFDLIGDDFAAFQLTGSVLKDEAQPPGNSQYFDIKAQA